MALNVAEKPWALTSLDAVREYVRPSASDETDLDALLILLINEVSAWMEGATGRRLASRPYARSRTVGGCETTVGSETLETSGAFTDVRAGMLISGVGLSTENYVRTVDSDTALTMLEAATVDASPLTATFVGRSPLKASGNGGDEIIVSEWPIREVLTIGCLDSDGALTLLDTTGARFYANKIVLPYDYFPRGRFNIEIEAVIGYGGTDYEAERARLEYACRRLSMVAYQDWRDKVGRVTTLSGPGGISLSFIDRALPSDVQAILDQFTRHL